MTRNRIIKAHRRQKRWWASERSRDCCFISSFSACFVWFGKQRQRWMPKMKHRPALWCQIELKCDLLLCFVSARCVYGVMCVTWLSNALYLEHIYFVWARLFHFISFHLVFLASKHSASTHHSHTSTIISIKVDTCHSDVALCGVCVCAYAAIFMWSFCLSLSHFSIGMFAKSLKMGGRRG